MGQSACELMLVASTSRHPNKRFEKAFMLFLLCHAMYGLQVILVTTLSE
jgi:hypothetical protein